MLSVIGVPKTIDNDIPYIDHSFGFQTAFARAAESIRAAHTEASSTPDGVGLVKLMGLDLGFIACYAALANHDADCVLIPEVPVSLDGPGGFLAWLRRRVAQRGHAVIVVAEGAGQDLIASDGTLMCRATSGWLTSGNCCARGSPGTSRPPVLTSVCATWILATPSAASPRTHTTPYPASGCPRLPSTPRWPGVRRWWSAGGTAGSCTCPSRSQQAVLTHIQETLR